jgi:hypothetical protein
VHSRTITVDGFSNLYAGREVVTSGIPRIDPFTIAGNAQPWIDHQWLAHAAYFLSWQVGGYAGVAVLCALAVTAGFALLFGLLRSRGGSPLASALWTLAALLACLSSVTPRAQVFAFPLFAGLLWWLLSSDRSPRRWQRWLVVPLVALWGNLHGSVLLGVTLVLVQSLWDAAREAGRGRLGDAAGHGCLLVAVCAAPLVNPYGTQIWSYYRDVLGSEAISQQVSEWQPLDLGDTNQLPLLLLVAVSAAVVVWSMMRGRPVRLALLLLSLLTLALVLRSGRQEMWVAMVLAVLIVDTSAYRGPEPAGHGQPLVRHAVLAASVVLAGLAAAFVLTGSAADFEAAMPRNAVGAAAEELRASPQATLLGDEAMTLLIWRAPHSYGRVGYDIRYEIYPPAALRSYFDFLDARSPAGLGLAARYDVVLISKQAHPKLAKAVSSSADWSVVYSDLEGLVAKRRS